MWNRQPPPLSVVRFLDADHSPDGEAITPSGVIMYCKKCQKRYLVSAPDNPEPHIEQCRPTASWRIGGTVALLAMIGTGLCILAVQAAIVLWIWRYIRG